MQFLPPQPTKDFQNMLRWVPDNCSTRRPCVVELSRTGDFVRYIERCRHHHALVETRSDREIYDEIVTENREREPLLEGEERPEPLPREDVPPRTR